MPQRPLISLVMPVRDTRGESGYLNQLILTRNVSAVTGACMAIRRTVFCEFGGFDTGLQVSYSDIDLSVRLIEAGYRIVWTPYAAKPPFPDIPGSLPLSCKKTPGTRHLLALPLSTFEGPPECCLHREEGRDTWIRDIQTCCRS